MAYRHHALSALLVVDPDEARRRMKKAFVDARASRTVAASLLGCGRVTFLRWAKQLGLNEWMREVEDLAKEKGWHHATGGLALHRAYLARWRRSRARSKNSSGTAS